MQDALYTPILDATMQVIARPDHPLAGVYRTVVHLATRHHAILLEEPAYGGCAAFALGVAAEILGVPTKAILQHPDIIFQPSDGNGISVDTVREITNAVSLSSQTGTRVVIWEDISRMNVASANAFLKCLEEPTSKTIFLVTAPSAGSLLETISSRLLHVALQRAHLKDISILLQEESSSTVDTTQLPPLITAALALDAREKKLQLHQVYERCLDISNMLVQDTPESTIEAYHAILSFKEDQKKMHLFGGIQPLDLLCYCLEGSIEKMLHSTNISALSPHIFEIAEKILRFRQDLQNNMSIKLATLDLLFGPKD